MWDRPSCAVLPALNYDLLFFSLCLFSRSAFCHFYLACSCFNPLPSVGETLSSWLEMFWRTFSWATWSQWYWIRPSSFQWDFWSEIWGWSGVLYSISSLARLRGRSFKKSSIAWWFLVFFIFYDGSHTAFFWKVCLKPKLCWVSMCLESDVYLSDIEWQILDMCIKSRGHPWGQKRDWWFGLFSKSYP